MTNASIAIPRDSRPDVDFVDVDWGVFHRFSASSIMSCQSSLIQESSSPFPSALIIAAVGSLGGVLRQ